MNFTYPKSNIDRVGPRIPPRKAAEYSYDGVGTRRQISRTARRSHAGSPDVCTYLFGICQRCQTDFLDARGITCFFDVDSGALPAWTCDAIGRIVRALIIEICHDDDAGISGGQITVTLRHREGLWFLAVTDAAVRRLDRETASGSGLLIESLVSALKGTSRTRLTRNGAVTAVAFAIQAGELAPRQIGRLSKAYLRSGGAPQNHFRIGTINDRQFPTPYVQ